MARVAVIIDRNFEDRELHAMMNALRDAGHEPIPVGVRAADVVEGRRQTARVTTEVAARDLEPDSVEGLVIPSGYRQEQLMTHHEELLNAARDVYARGKPVGAFSASGWIILESDPTHGANLISWPTVKRDLLNVNTDWQDLELIDHDAVRYSHRPNDLASFVAAFVHALGGTRAYTPAASEPIHALE